jgi:hypothetical protein
MGIMDITRGNIDIKHHIASQISWSLYQHQSVKVTITIRKGVSHDIPAMMMHEAKHQLDEDLR